ncbi:hypothetical protein N039_05555 [Staphylococcus sp. EGD-HP3]|nr:hypothetical protein N039_05555 [Staphylococcus sp. EGD-HP3]
MVMRVPIPVAANILLEDKMTRSNAALFFNKERAFLI